MESFSERQKEIIDIYNVLLKENGRFPARSDLCLNGINRDQVRSHFGNYENLRNIVSKQYPELIESIKEKQHKHADFTKEALGSIVKDNDFKDGTFFITAASPVNY